jgi:hypothetical protein
VGDEGFHEPVLIVAFNRPDRVAGLIERLRAIRPTSVFFAVDGPRDQVATDPDRVRATREAIEAIDWSCDLHTLFQESNLGCGRGVSTAIDWFFANVERGVILEDDVLPRPEFFPFCAELLQRYENDPRVFAISGCNFVPPVEQHQPSASYRFSAITHVWGWATWRRSWQQYKFDMSTWRQRLPLGKRWPAMGGDIGGFLYWTAVYDWMRFGNIDTWDYQLSLAQMADGGLTATANTNLVDNVGFTEDSTHTNYQPGFVRPSAEITFPLSHPIIERDLKADRWTRSRVLQTSTQSLGRMARDNVLQRTASATQRIRRQMSPGV